MRYTTSRKAYVGADLRYLVLSQTPAHTARPLIRASVSCNVPVRSPSKTPRRWVLISHTHGGMAQDE